MKTRIQDLPELLSVKEVSELLRTPLPTVYYLAQRDELPGAFRIGGRWKFRKKQIVDHFKLEEAHDAPEPEAPATPEGTELYYLNESERQIVDRVRGVKAGIEAEMATA